MNKTLTPIVLPTNTSTVTETATPTGTWFIPTNTSTPTRTITACATYTNTSTACPTNTWVTTNKVIGNITYTGSGTVDCSHPISVKSVSGYPFFYPTNLCSNSGAYTLSSPNTGINNVSAYYNFSGGPVPGTRFANGGSCGSPASPATFAVTFIAGTNTGPDITIDDSCSYQGIYGTVTYSGSKGRVLYCRQININTYSDSGYTTPFPYGIQFSNNSMSYNIVSNLGASPTGLTPMYIRVWYDANGSYLFDAGDPYLELGLVTPSSDGVLQNISFGDTYIK